MGKKSSTRDIEDEFGDQNKILRSLVGMSFGARGMPYGQS